MSTNERIRKLWITLEPYVLEQGFEIIELEFGAYGKSSVLRVYIENPNRPVTIDDCTEVSHVLSNVLDTVDMGDQSYILEVSSPGFDRPLRREKDFMRFTGETVRIQTDMPIKGRRNFKGTLQGIENEMVLVDVNGEIFQIHLENLKHANLVR